MFLGTIDQIQGVPLSRNVPMSVVLEYKRQNLGMGTGIQSGGEMIMGAGAPSRSITPIMGASSSQHTGMAHSERLPGSPAKQTAPITPLLRAGLGTSGSETSLGVSGLGLGALTPAEQGGSTPSAASTSAEKSGSVTLTQTPTGPGSAMVEETVPPGDLATITATVISAEALVLQQAQALVKEQQEKMRRQA